MVVTTLKNSLAHLKTRKAALQGRISAGRKGAAISPGRKNKSSVVRPHSPKTAKILDASQIAVTNGAEATAKMKGPRVKAAPRAKSGKGGAATEPTAAEVAEREAVARTFFDPTATAAAHAAFVARKDREPTNGH